jgi:hypothetical protein
VEAFFWGINALADCFTLINDFDFFLLFVLLLVLARFLDPFFDDGFTAGLDGVLTVVLEGALTAVFGLTTATFLGAVTRAGLVVVRLAESTAPLIAIIESLVGKSLAEN